VARHLRKAKKSLRTYKVQQGYSKDRRPLRSPSRACVAKSDIRPFPPFVLDRRTKSNVPSQKGWGIKFHKHYFNNQVVLNEHYMVLLRLYELCRYSFSLSDVRSATQTYHQVRRHFVYNKDVFAGSRTAKQFWRAISITLRFSKSSATRKDDSFGVFRTKTHRTGASASILRGIGSRLVAHPLRGAPTTL
jgi:hypothetical protein